MGSKEEPIIDDSFYVIFNAHHEALQYSLPEDKYGIRWIKILDTFEGVVTAGETYQSRDILIVEGRSIILLQNPKA